jgi:hypothetical protein
VPPRAPSINGIKDKFYIDILSPKLLG